MEDPVPTATTARKSPVRKSAIRRNITAGHDEKASYVWTCIGLCVQARVPAMLWGDPGIGKSAQVERLPKVLASVSEVVATSVANRENVDFNGVINVRADGKSEYSAFTWVEQLEASAAELAGEPVQGPSPLWFVDEVTTGDGSVQKALLRPIQERVIGNTPISSDVAIVLAGNDPAVAADGSYLEPPLANRCAHFELELDRAGWLNGLVSGFAESAPPVDLSVFAENPQTNYAQAAYIVSTYLEANPSLINPPVPTEAKYSSKAWASGRSWHNLTRVLAHLELVEDNAGFVTALAKAFIGDGAREFGDYFVSCLTYDLPKVLSGEQEVRWRTEKEGTSRALINAIARLGCSGEPRMWELAEDVMVDAHNGGRRDLAAAGLVKLYAAIPPGAHSSEDATKIAASLDDMVDLT